MLTETLSHLHSLTRSFRPEVGIILGTGLAGLVADIDVEYEIAYEDIPHFVHSTVESHKGKLIFGRLAGKPVVCMQGRFHYYEGYSMKEITYPVRVMQALGIRNLLISNAAGGLNPAFSEADIMLITDHISLFLPDNPLFGKNTSGDRFPDMSEPYCPDLLEKARRIIREQGIGPVQEGVYVPVPGPQLETRAEYRLLRQLGADAVGMSTVPEVIVAVQLKIPVLAVSVITDMCIPETLKKAELQHILANAATAEPRMTLLFRELIKTLD
ncbi:MAG: purine-nucleoside phosphorylase [Leadbetterella sp.]|nr:purine-nucleoside phosphorylase [Leadbetterella sp.]